MESEQEKAPRKVTDIDAARDNIEAAVAAFAQQWEPAPRFKVGVEVADVGGLRNMMGLRASIDVGDPWPAAEKRLHEMGFRWQQLGGQRVMYLQERDGFVPDTGWEEAEAVEVKNEEFATTRKGDADIINILLTTKTFKL